MANKMKLLTIAFLVFVLVIVVTRPGIEATEKVFSFASEVPVWKVDGEWVVKAEDVQKQLDAGLEALRNQIPNVISQVSPSVVAIVGKPNSSAQLLDDRFSLSHGTGVIVDADGTILTNAHVIQDMRNITVITADGNQYAAKRTHIDAESDLALVKIDANDLPTAVFSNGPVQVGETAIAIGNPISFSLQNSATVGTVSGTDRSISATYRLLQTDAAINPGNSGGPLVNLDGEIIGIITMKYVSEEIDNLSFAIPSDTVQYVYEHFQKYGKVKRPYAGIQWEESWAAIVGLPTKEPLKVSRVEIDSPAYKSGIRAGDLLYRIEDHAIHTIVDYNEALKSYLPGEEVVFMMQSKGNLVWKTVKLH